MEVTIENAVRESPSLKLVEGGGRYRRKRVAARQHCAKLAAALQQFPSGAEKFLQPGMLTRLPQQPFALIKTDRFDVHPNGICHPSDCQLLSGRLRLG